jgi:hypothetical protein
MNTRVTRWCRRICDGKIYEGVKAKEEKFLIREYKK